MISQDRTLTTISITVVVVALIVFAPALAEQSYQNGVDEYNRDLEKHNNKYRNRFDTCLSMDTELQKRDCFEFYGFDPHYENDEMAYNEYVDDKFTNTKPDRYSHWLMIGIGAFIFGAIASFVLFLLLLIIIERAIKINLSRIFRFKRSKNGCNRRLLLLKMGVSRESEMMTRIRDLENAVFRRDKS